MSLKGVMIGNKPDWKDKRTTKWCMCGGHNASNPKRNLHHHSTLSKLMIKKSRKTKQAADILEDWSDIVDAFEKYTNNKPKHKTTTWTADNISPIWESINGIS